MKKVMVGIMVMLVLQVCTSELSEIDGVIVDHVDMLGGGDPVSKIPNDKFLGQYFSSSNSRDPISTRIENRIRHDFNSPVRNDIVLNDLGAKWSGDFYFVSGEYNFAINSDKGVKLLIDNKVVLNEVGNSGVSVYNISQQLDGVHRVVVEYNLSEEPTVNTNQEVQPEADSPVVVDPEPEVVDPVPVVVPEIVDPIVIDPVVVEPEPEVVEPEPEVVEPEPEVVEPEPEVVEPEPEVIEPEPEVIEPEPEVIDPEPVVEEDNATPTIEVSIEPVNSDCETRGKYGDEAGFGVWCWGDVDLPDYSGKKGEEFSDEQLIIDSECYEKQVSVVGDQLRFYLNPISPDAGNWCSNSFNLRAEIGQRPYGIQKSEGTEEWFGWTYSFGDKYKIDPDNDWLFFQVQPGVRGVSPAVKLLIASAKGAGQSGEIVVGNLANYPDFKETGIIPKAGDKFEIVVHIIWGRGSSGLLEVWIDDKNVYSKRVSTVYSEYRWGGGAKWGVYKHGWRNGEDVEKSLKNGVDHLETFMGSLRVLTRFKDDPEHGKDAYDLVKPR